ncbi:hypothetical protein QBZ16_001364 [Prototheca wickerhamii]|uniref:Pterin-binding domain-containing protein n=1 Tax=Prototheca wickerhamii TaxID=3111 RepID=A0AAD9IDN8_PROWI|nr:hypothetical protein QBZ16_001364 [Prototheca wickerhamii]
MVRAVIAIGTNLVLSLARLYESAPQYVVEQPQFLNTAALVSTIRSPLDLLDALKAIEADLGRDFGAIRNGPRPIDLDIVFYGSELVDHPRLTLPHPRWEERTFAGELGASLTRGAAAWAAAGGERRLGSAEAGLAAWLPLGRPAPQQRGLLWGGALRPHVMGILNLTPDSFSDGGALLEAGGGLREALAAARRLVAAGATLLDVGGQSTRPGADLISQEEEAGRVIPFIREMRQCPDLQDVAVSVDTFYSGVAERAVAAGADVVNDVSGGRADPDMLPMVAEAGVPYVLMHSYGPPERMASGGEHLAGAEDIVGQIGDELGQMGARALEAGLLPAQIVLDPGLGFGKTAAQSSQVLGRLGDLQAALAPYGLHRAPLLVGASRKRFLAAPGQPPLERDGASAAAAALAAYQGATVIRTHNVEMTAEAVRIAHDCLTRQ